MYSKNNLIYILTILESIEKILKYSNEFENSEDFFQANDQMNFNASYTLLLTIGEDVKKIDSGLKQNYTDIPWKEIASLRDRLAHDYRGIDPEITYSIIKNYLPDLKTTAIQMLDDIEYEEDILVKAISSDFYKHLSYLIESKKKKS